MLGLARKKVFIAKYDTTWPKAFEEEKKSLVKILGKDCIAIEHIGSTSVPGLSAKPLVDIAVGVPSIRDKKKYVQMLEKAGYVHRPGFKRPNQHFVFAKGNTKVRTHYIHVVKYGGAFWKKWLAFRDYLRAHPREAAKYAALKEILAKKHPDDRALYTKKKSEFVHRILARVRAI